MSLYPIVPVVLEAVRSRFINTLYISPSDLLNFQALIALIYF
jgi:hypothetical protein